MKKPANYRVVVTVDEPWVLDRTKTHHYWMLALSACAASIRRHVDGIKNVACEYDHVCSHCGSAWEEPPECCGKAIEEADAAKEVQP